ncbi:hypothetical protein V5O48_017069 [Marasmius crinis-equi]|uniref:MYND-type domain-containing protein n=1 Tax=Marasmius crinis-equi TaxID=585013 RepID=A0ABR3EQ55_9AGAR
MIVLHPSVGFSIDALAPLLRSTPEIFAVTFELWLYASEMDHPSAGSLLTSAGVLFDGHTGLEIAHKRCFTGKVLVELDKVLRKKRRDIPTIFMRSLTRGMCTPQPDYLSLSYHVLIPNALLRSTDTLKLSDFNAKDAIRRISKLFGKLLSNQRDVSKFEERDEVIILFAIECLHYIECSVMSDAYFFIPALDEGILLSFMKAKDPLIDDYRPNPPPTTTLSFHFTFICNLLLERILFRPILIRLVHWFKRIDKAGLDRLNDSRFDPNPLNLFRKAWNILKEDAYRRSSLRDPDRVRAFMMCEYPKCPRKEDPSHEKPASHPLMRCSGCQSFVYCSRECQKNDWRNGHREKCLIVQKHIRGGKYPRIPGHFDLLFARKQLIADYDARIDQITQLRRDLKVSKPHRGKVHLVAWFDYSSELPFELTVHSPEEHTQRLRKLTLGARYLNSSTPAIGVIPWRGNEPMLVGF